jgi:hypothetical protein
VTQLTADPILPTLFRRLVRKRAERDWDRDRVRVRFFRSELSTKTIQPAEFAASVRPLATSWNRVCDSRFVRVSLWALMCYRDLVILADFEIIPILIYLNLTDPWSPDPRSHPPNSLDRNYLNILKNDGTPIVHQCPVLL